MIAQETCSELERVGATVAGPVPSVNEATQLIETEPQIDAAVLDVNLGDEKSFPIAEAVVTRGIPFLFATGYNFGDVPSELRHATIVMKPLRVLAVEQLLATDDPA